MKKRLHPIIIPICCTLLIACQSNRIELTINIGEQELNHHLVRFTLPERIHADDGEWELYNTVSGISFPAQRLSDSQAVFLLSKQVLQKGEHTFLLKPTKKANTSMYAEMGGGNIQLKSREEEMLTYNISIDCPDATHPEYYCRSGYIHPVCSPEGALLTDGFPWGHMHQHGIFFAWTNTTFRGEFVDFWNQHKEKGTARHKTLISTTSGSVFCGYTAVLNQLSLMHGPVLEERWDVRAYDLGDCYIFDLISNQKNITNDTLYLNKHIYGGFGLRGSKLWNADDTIHFEKKALFLTSEGLTGDNANHSRPQWTAMYGNTEKGIAGIAVLDHPENYRHPQFTRVHPEMPYFSITPIADTSAFFAPGSDLTWKYRFVTFDGLPDTAALNALWKDFAEPVFLAIDRP